MSNIGHKTPFVHNHLEGAILKNGDSSVLEGVFCRTDV